MARCATCRDGWVPDLHARIYPALGPAQKPCPDCGGSCIVHCCEGERPDPATAGLRPDPEAAPA